jgi:DeoR family fructose operon transcriptional repressor
MGMFEFRGGRVSDSLRQAEILRRAVNAPMLRVRDLASEFGVHDMTIRRDFDALSEQGLMERVRGGARLRERMSEELNHQLRAGRHTEAKSAIARAAVALIDDGDTIAFDASTTALHLVRLMSGRAVSAIVSSLDAAAILAAAGTDFVLIGGTFHAEARSFTGVLFEDAMARLHPDKLFFSTKGFHAALGLTDSHLPEVGAKRAMLRSGATAIGLIDSSKFGRRALATIATLTELDIIVTDVMPSESDRAALDAADIRLIVAED